MAAGNAWPRKDPSTEMTELPKQYDHLAAQDRWYPFWERQGYFHSEPDASKQPFCMVIPPPNVTGALHLGHALNNTLQDILVRLKRMQGFNALWMPGTDHAGIATQAVVERRLLAEEGKTRHDLGREALVERIWKWKDEYEARILGQLKQMGCSCDWQRTRFTLDDVCARAVRFTFFSWFEKGLIYRGKRLINWDTQLQTAVADDEIFYEEVPGHFYHIRYEVIDPQPDEPKFLTVATTRPETLLGDTAVAVHPDPEGALEKALADLVEKQSKGKPSPELAAQITDLEERRLNMLNHLKQLRDMALDGRQLMLPLLRRPIPLVCDAWAKPELGSGCVKITPGHDPNDYEVGLRQDLPMIDILNNDGTLNEHAGPYQGLTIKAAREKVVADLREADQLELVEDRLIDLAHSDRSKTPIEPRLNDQWFVRMSDVEGRPGLAQMAMDAVSGGDVKIVPERYAKSYLDWLGEKRDWCISRQLWWGHRIPIWYCNDADEKELQQAFRGRDDIVFTRDEAGSGWLICSRDEDLAADTVAGRTLRQDPDVLDTWFSSQLWPHSTLGWPDPTPELEYYYPTSVLSTGRDIISLWVARMVVASLHNRGQVPFHEVFIHPKILDGYGETMSKSKGNGVDPIDVIAKFGADALRYGLAYLTTETQDVRMPVEFECPHCGGHVEQTKENRLLPRIKCDKCKQPFSTQWADKPEDKQLARAAVVSDRFELGRNFCNKLWNASRFALMNLEGFSAAPIAESQLLVEDRWVLSRLATVTDEVTQALAEFRFADATRSLYDFSWDEFCSFFLEMLKYRLNNADLRAVAQRVLCHTLDTLLRLLHPFIPFLTEEVWQLLRQIAPERGLESTSLAAESVMIAPWPAADAARRNPQIEAQFRAFQDVLRGVRDIRGRQNIAPKKTVEFVVRCDDSTAALLLPMQPYFASMAGAEVRDWGPNVAAPSPSASFSLPGIEVFVDLADLIDVEAERAKNEREREKLLGLISAKEKKLANEGFVSRAPANVVQGEKDALADLQSKLAAVEAFLAELKSK